MRRCLIALLALGCGEVHFVEPEPPQLYRARPQFTPMSIAEPLVWIAVLDLFVEDAATCAWARETTLSTLRDAVASVGGAQLELPAQDLAPDCQMRGRQPVNVDAVRNAFVAAQITYAGSHVRPLIFYVDNIDLVLPAQIASALTSVATSQPPAAILWPISLPSVAAQLRVERTTEWTYVGDPDLSSRLKSAFSLYLPLQTTASPTSGPVPLLDPAQLETTREFKICALPQGANIEDPPQLGVTSIVDRAHPPTITYDLPQFVAVPKVLFPSLTFSVLVEACTANCDRFYIRDPGDVPRRWDATGCVLGVR